MHTVIKRYKQKLERLNRYSVFNLSRVGKKIIDNQSNEIICAPVKYSYDFCNYVIYNTFTDEHYVHITREYKSRKALTLYFYSINNFKNSIILQESRTKHIYSPVASSNEILQTDVSVVFPVLNKLLKFNYKLPYRLYSIDSYITNYIGTVFTIVFNMYDEDYAIYAPITDTMRKIYPSTAIKLTYKNLLAYYVKDHKYVTLMNFFNDDIYLQVKYNYWDYVFKRYKEYALFDILI